MKKKTNTRRKRLSMEELIPNKAHREELLRQLYSGTRLFGEDGIFTDLLQSFVNAALEGEMDYHLKQEREAGRSNRRNGLKKKTLRTESGAVEIVTPRDRNGTHEPKLVKKWDRELQSGLDELIMHLYAKGNSYRDIQDILQQIYGVEVSTGAISAITDKIWNGILEWQRRPLAPCYVIVYLDGIHYRARQEGKVQDKMVYTLYGIGVEGEREVLGLYMGSGAEGEGARQWGLFLEDLRARGVEDVLFFCVDGLKGFSQAIEEVFPCSLVQRCIVHMVRTSIRFVSNKDVRPICKDLKTIYQAANREQAKLALESFGEKWDKKYPEIKKKWLAHWEELMAYMDYPHAVRRMIYTTNPVEAVHRSLRKVTKSKGAWVNEKGLLKQLYLALQYNEKSWKRKVYNWPQVQRALFNQFGQRYTKWLSA